MEYRDLIPLFCCSGALNVALIICAVYLVYLNRKVRTNEFYRIMILGMVSLAYISRITLFIYLCVRYPNLRFNRDEGTPKQDFLRNFLIYSAALLHPLAAYAYISRWAGYLWLTAAKHTVDEYKIARRIRWIRISLFILTVISFIFLLLKCFVYGVTFALTIYLLFLYLATPPILLAVVYLFLKRLKQNLPKLYRKAYVARIYSVGISAVLIFRGLSILLDLVVHHVEESENKGLFLFNDILQLSFYFIETFPSIVIIIVLWRSYKETRCLTSSKECLDQTETLLRDQWR